MWWIIWWRETSIQSPRPKLSRYVCVDLIYLILMCLSFLTAPDFLALWLFTCSLIQLCLLNFSVNFIHFYSGAHVSSRMRSKCNFATVDATKQASKWKVIPCIHCIYIWHWCFTVTSRHSSCAHCCVLCAYAVPSCTYQYMYMNTCMYEYTCSKWFARPFKIKCYIIKKLRLLYLVLYYVVSKWDMYPKDPQSPRLHCTPHHWWCNLTFNAYTKCTLCWIGKHNRMQCQVHIVIAHAHCPVQDVQPLLSTVV